MPLMSTTNRPSADGIEVGPVAHPPDHQVSLGEVWEHLGRRRLDADLGAVVVDSSCGLRASLRSPVALDRRLESTERRGPELVEEIANGFDRLRADRIQPTRAVATLGEHGGILEDPQVLRDRLRGDVEVLGDLAGGELSVSDEP